ncbi:10 kDa heat shock protein, mitochondrial [Drosophila hydei]|uniref:10 kDa heat shock protein, mitochondrial n=1 Tax=Drosophila hydei TaxID=7224 RepID=A0A6J1L9J0_DROHY|nr:10 kDa heat shock protein, mitochondrial [Drosophila hydei]XP_023161706.1 10 kDa heat shock protein, mitochondrial [Drosophila hydei]XP_023161707.1 10 kDa heat shock protein, mitochondrial [Drosophila hydei]
MANVIKKVVPMLDRILILRAEVKTTTAGGILLPEDSVPKEMQGVVVAVGPGARNPVGAGHLPVAVKEGDRVLLPKYGGTKVDMDDKREYVLFRESDILAKLE